MDPKQSPVDAHPRLYSGTARGRVGVAGLGMRGGRVVVLLQGGGTCPCNESHDFKLRPRTFWRRRCIGHGKAAPPPSHSMGRQRIQRIALSCIRPADGLWPLLSAFICGSADGLWGASQHAQIWPNCIATSTEEDTHRGRSQVSRIKGGCCPPRAALRVKAVPRVGASRTNMRSPLDKVWIQSNSCHYKIFWLR